MTEIECYLNTFSTSAQAELVAKFIDAELRSGGKGGKSDDELEATLDKALMLFRYIQVRAAWPRSLTVVWLRCCLTRQSTFFGVRT